MFFRRSLHEIGNDILVPNLIETMKSFSGSLVIESEGRTLGSTKTLSAAHHEPPVQRTARIEPSIQYAVDDGYIRVYPLNYSFNAIA